MRKILSRNSFCHQATVMWAFTIFVILLLYIFKNRIWRPPLYPPGPRPLPFIGNVISLCLKLKSEKLYHRVCQAWAKQYGDVFGLRLGLINVVVVSGKDMIKEVSSREVFEGRPDGFFYLMRSFGKKYGVVFSEGSSWFTTRKLVLKYLKTFGYGTRAMEDFVGEECRALVELRMKDAGTPIPINSMFDVSIVNILWRLVAGKRYELNDAHLQRICDLVTRSFKANNMSGGLLNFMPFLRHIMPDLIGYTELSDITDTLHGFIKETINEHRSVLNINQPKDVIDVFLIEMMKNKDNALTEEELQVVCMDMLQAGLETVTNTAVFMLLHMVRNPDVQARIQREIDSEVGNERVPALSDRSSMAYTEAVIMETLRISSVAAVAIPHMALDDAKLGDYIIPKGTFILMTLYDLHNGSHWQNPTEFRPERFLTKDGNVVQDEWLMPFGYGRRRCIGDVLARAELFMFLTHLLQKFTLKVPEGDTMPSAEPIDGVTLSAEPFRVLFEPRC